VPVPRAQRTRKTSDLKAIQRYQKNLGLLGFSSHHCQGMWKLLTNSCPSNNWAAKDAELTLLWNFGGQSSAPLNPNR
jgi:hypothetical protein